MGVTGGAFIPCCADLRRVVGILTKDPIVVLR
jgi:hypothetical protein